MNESNITFKATIIVTLGQLQEFQAKGNDVFPLLAAKLGWQLSGSWEQKNDDKFVTICNVWVTDQTNRVNLLKKFGDAQEDLEKELPGFKANVECLEEIIGDNESYSFSADINYYAGE
jgi:hypothetical protein